MDLQKQFCNFLLGGSHNIDTLVHQEWLKYRKSIFDSKNPRDMTTRNGPCYAWQMFKSTTIRNKLMNLNLTTNGDGFQPALMTVLCYPLTVDVPIIPINSITLPNPTEA